MLPDARIGWLQHAPARKEYDGFQGYPLHSVMKQIQAIETISDTPVVAVTINHENLELNKIQELCNELKAKYNLPFYDVLLNGADDLVNQIINYLHNQV